jgi:hypothetical protein
LPKWIIFGDAERYVTPEKTPPHNPVCFFLLLFLNIDLMEGCAPGVVRSGKKGESLRLPVSESVEPLPLPCPSAVDVAELLNESSAFFAAFSSFFLSFASSESNAILIISGLYDHKRQHHARGFYLNDISTYKSLLTYSPHRVCNSIFVGLSHLQGSHTPNMDPKASAYFLMKLTASKFNPKAQKNKKTILNPTRKK